jgi:hypothetical protein
MGKTDKINLKYVEKVYSLLNMSDTVAARALRTADKDYDTALKKVFTPDQWKKYEAMMAEQKP